MLVCILGPVQVRDGSTEVGLGGRRQRRVLTGLALGRGRSVSWEELETAAWGDEPPATARHTIATHVLRLRATGLVVSNTPSGYRLDTPTDAIEFEDAIESARRLIGSDPHRSIGLLRDAIALWRGRPLPELDHLPEAEIEAARLKEVVEAAREQLLRAELTVGRPDDLVGSARSLVAEEPYREHRWELLMMALYRSGRQAEALDVYSQARDRLLDELGVEPGPALQRMQRAVLAQDPALDGQPGDVAGMSAPRSRVPGTATRLIGRAQERRDLTEVWGRARLCTLIGPPGAGKTRLALDAASGADGAVWYVDVEHLPVTGPVAAAVLDVVAPSSRSLDPSDGLVERLRDATGLVVLDGCERRLAEVAAQVRRLLASCARVRVLVTSRERLGILDEALIAVGPLPPDDAVALLADRARLVNARFAVAPRDEATADRLCALVDRLPLALELVARHLNLLSLRELTSRVQTDLGRWAGRSAGGRDGLWLALDTSLAALSDDERHVLLAFAIMVSDADTDLVGDVVDPVFTGDLHDVIGRLVDASLVQVRSAMSTTRCQLLRTVAVHTIEASGTLAVANARLRYTDAVLERVVSVIPRLASQERHDALRELDNDMPHVRAVFGELCTPGADPRLATRGLEVAALLTDYWLGRRPAEGLDWLTQLIAAADPSRALRAEALLRCGHLAYWLTDFGRGSEVVSAARDLFRDLGDALGEGRALRRLGAISAATDDLASARDLLEASLGQLDEADVEAETGITLLHLGSLLADEGDVAAALLALRRALRIAVDGGNPLARGQALAALLLAEWKGGELEAALHAGDEALELFRELGHHTMEGTVAYRLAAVTRALGRSADARRLSQLAIDAGEAVGTRTTVALGHLNLARLDLDDGQIAGAGIHVDAALAVIDPEADRWVLVEAVEVVARLLSLVGRSGAVELLDAAVAIRADIRQPVPSTDVADIEATRARTGLPASTHGPSSHSAVDVHRDARATLLEVSRRMAS